MTPSFEHDNSQTANLILILKQLLGARRVEVSSAALACVSPLYGELVEELQAIGFPITVRPELCDGTVSVYFRLERRAVTQEVPRTMLRVCDLIRRIEALPPEAWERGIELFLADGSVLPGESV